MNLNSFIVLVCLLSSIKDSVYFLFKLLTYLVWPTILQIDYLQSVKIIPVISLKNSRTKCEDIADYQECVTFLTNKSCVRSR